MRRLVHLALLSMVMAVSCAQNADTEQSQDSNKHVSKDRLYCSFISVDAYDSIIDLDYSDAYGPHILLGLKINGKGPGYYEQYKIKDEDLDEKAKLLADELLSYNFSFDVGVDTELYIICAGISGDVKVYADKDVAGRKAGEDLSDMLECFSMGRIKYPEMTVVPDSHLIEALNQKKGPDYTYYGYKEYNSIGTIPLFGIYADADRIAVSPSKQYSSIFDEPMTVHFVIPAIGLDKNGKEKSIEFRGSCVIN